MSEFVADLAKIKERARQHMDQGAVTGNYKADSQSGDQGVERGFSHRVGVRAPLPPPLLHGNGHQRRGNQGRISSARE